MKEIVKTSRLAGSLEKLFRMLNHDFFGDALEMPIITIQSTPKAYGHYTTFNAWNVKGEGRREINLGAGTLDRPLEYTVTTLIHEMVHMFNDTVLHEKDTSNKGVYHNKVFKREAEAHGLICHQNGHHGWSDTSSELSDRLIEWVLLNDIPEIRMTRDELPAFFTVKGKGSKTPSNTTPTPAKKPSNKRIMQCPQCGCKADVHSPKTRIGCWTCGLEMVQVN